MTRGPGARPAPSPGGRHEGRSPRPGFPRGPPLRRPRGWRRQEPAPRDRPGARALPRPLRVMPRRGRARRHPGDGRRPPGPHPHRGARRRLRPRARGEARGRKAHGRSPSSPHASLGRAVRTQLAPGEAWAAAQVWKLTRYLDFVQETPPADAVAAPPHGR